MALSPLPPLLAAAAAAALLAVAAAVLSALLLLLLLRITPHTTTSVSPPPPPPPSRPQMFANDPPYDKSLEQLGAYLSALVAEERLSCEGGLYRKRS